MNVESEALVTTLLELIEEPAEIMPLACHDAIFVPQNLESKYKEVFNRNFEKACEKRRQKLLQNGSDLITQLKPGERYLIHHAEESNLSA